MPSQLKERSNHMNYLNQLICDTEVELYVLSTPHKDSIGLVSSPLGITNFSATILLVETGNDKSAGKKKPAK